MDVCFQNLSGKKYILLLQKKIIDKNLKHVDPNEGYLIQLSAMINRFEMVGYFLQASTQQGQFWLPA